MECRRMEITLVSAHDLPDIRKLGEMKVYAEMCINRQSGTMERTPTDMEGKTNPTWNFPVVYTVGEPSVQQPGTLLTIKLYCKRTFRSDKYIGKVSIPIKSLFDQKDIRGGRILLYRVAGTENGCLRISYTFDVKMWIQVRRPGSSTRSRSGWKNALEIGFLVLVGGAILLLGDNHDDEAVQPDDSDNINNNRSSSNKYDLIKNNSITYNGVRFYDTPSLSA